LNRWRSLLPGPAELVFLMLLGIILVGGRHALFHDPGTFWHLRLGRDILETRMLPVSDTLMFTHAGAPWIDQSWGFDVLLALLVDCAGWDVVVALTAALLAGVYAALTMVLVRGGISPAVAVGVAVLAAAAGAHHFLIRPHLFTLALVFVSLQLCSRQHEQGGWSVFFVPGLTALLANLHGGFIALPLIVATAAVGHAVSGPWDGERKRQVVRFAMAFLACCLAGLINPYGIALYRHVGELLFSSGVTAMIDEYQPAPFGHPRALILEWIVLALIGLPVFVSARPSRYAMVHLLVWLHLALTSIRHAPLFALAAAPVLATLIDGLPLTFRCWWKKPESRPFWIPASLAGLVLLVALPVPLGGFDWREWPLDALVTLDRQPASGRLFHELNWGGLIAAECRPPRLSYADDRFELIGRDGVVELGQALDGGPAWDTVRDRDRIDLVLIRPDRGLARRLECDPDWRILHRDEIAVLFARGRAASLTSR
jgi:hypothetical protein